MFEDNGQVPARAPALAVTQKGIDENNMPYASPIQALRPHIAADIVTRPRLLRLLEPGADLTLVVAPAGYGKTTMIADWLDTCGLSTAWVTFDAQVTDLHHFLTHLLTAVRASLPGFAGDLLQDLRTVRTLPPPSVIAEMLHAAFAALDGEFVLVLDDYHTVAAPEAHTLLTALLRLPSTPLRLVLATRHDPPLPLVSLRAHGQLIEIRSHDLSFTAAEAVQFLAGASAAALSEQEIGDLVRATEGWPASLRLTQLYLRQEQGFASLTRAIEVGTRRARDFLAEEVFAGLPLPIQTFLMQTAILEQLSARVCTAVSGDDDPTAAQANLRWLVANGVFTVALDDAHEWFRCHALLRQFAHQQLHAHYDDAQVTILHRRASGWFAAEGHTAAAIRHALAANAVTDAVSILARARPALMDAARWMEVAHLLHLFSAAQIEAEPELLLAQAWFARSQNNIGLLQASLQQAETVLEARAAAPAAGSAPDALTGLRGEIETLVGHLCYWHADLHNVVAHTVRALALLPHTARFARGFAALFCVVGHWTTASQAATFAILDHYAQSLNPHDAIDQIYLLTSAASLYALAGDLPSLAATAERMLALGAGQSWTEPLAVAHYNRLAVHYWRNELTDVETLAIAMLAHRYQVSPRYLVQSACILALAYQAEGRVADANAVAAAELAYIEHNGVTEMLPYLHALQADLALRQGNVEAAASLLRETAQTPLSPTVTHYTPHLATLRLYLLQGTRASLDAAASLLSRLERFWREIGHAHILLELAVLKSLYWQARGKEEIALEILAQAARVAEPVGCIRLFADRGIQLDGLLAKLQQMGVAPLFVAAVRGVIATAPPVHESRLAPPPLTEARATPQIDDLAVLLTFREQEVLQLLGEHLSNQEIAARLCISPQTVKRHLISIFRKLNVKNRRAAALHARQLAPATP